MKLKVLRIEIGDVGLVEENVQLTSCLEEYAIAFSARESSWSYTDYNTSIILDYIPQGTKLGIWINQLLLTCECILCHKVDLKNLFSFQGMERGFSQLKSLQIESCYMLEEVFNYTEVEGASHCHMTFPKLETLKLRGLLSLVAFAKGVESIKFPLLSKLEIDYCPKLTRFMTSIQGDPNSASQDNDHKCQLFNTQKVTK